MRKRISSFPTLNNLPETPIKSTDNNDTKETANSFQSLKLPSSTATSNKGIKTKSRSNSPTSQPAIPYSPASAIINRERGPLHFSEEITDPRQLVLFFASLPTGNKPLELLLEPEVINSHKIGRETAKLHQLKKKYYCYECQLLLLDIFWYIFNKTTLLEQIDQNFIHEFETNLLPIKKIEKNESEQKIKNKYVEEKIIDAEDLKKDLIQYEKKLHHIETQNDTAEENENQSRRIKESKINGVVNFAIKWIDKNLHRIINERKKVYENYLVAHESTTESKTLAQSKTQQKKENQPNSHQQSLSSFSENVKKYWQKLKQSLNNNKKVIEQINSTKLELAKKISELSDKIYKIDAQLISVMDTEEKINVFKADYDDAIAPLTAKKAASFVTDPRIVLGQRISPAQKWINEDENNEKIYVLADIPIQQNPPLPDNLFTIVNQFFINLEKEKKINAESVSKSSINTKTCIKKLTFTPATTPFKPTQPTHLDPSSIDQKKNINNDSENREEKKIVDSSFPSSSLQNSSSFKTPIKLQPRDLDKKHDLDDPSDDFSPQPKSRKNSTISDDSTLENGSLETIISQKNRKHALKMLVQRVINLQNNFLKKLLRYYTIRSHTQYLMSYITTKAEGRWSWSSSSQLRENEIHLQKTFFLMAEANNARNSKLVYEKSVYNFQESRFQIDFKKRWSFFLCCCPSLDRFTLFQSTRRKILNSLDINVQNGFISYLNNIDSMDPKFIRDQLMQKLIDTHFHPDSKPNINLNDIISWPKMLPYPNEKPNILISKMQEAISNSNSESFNKYIDNMSDESFNNIFLNSEHPPLEWIRDYNNLFELTYAPNMWKRIKALEQLFNKPENYLRFKSSKTNPHHEVNKKLNHILNSKWDCLKAAFQISEGTLFKRQIECEVSNLRRPSNEKTIANCRMLLRSTSDSLLSRTQESFSETSMDYLNIKTEPGDNFKKTWIGSVPTSCFK